MNMWRRGRRGWGRRPPPLITHFFRLSCKKMTSHKMPFVGIRHISLPARLRAQKRRYLSADIQSMPAASGKTAPRRGIDGAGDFALVLQW